MTTPPRLRWLLLLSVVVAMAACTTTRGDASSKEEPAGGAGGGTAEAVKPGPADRDENALLTALRTLDACTLFDKAAVVAAGFTGDTLIARSPHTCVFVAKSAPLDELHVRIGSEFLFPARYFGQPLNLAGFRGYLDNTSDGPNSNKPSCQVDLPVNPERSISFWVRRDEGSFDPCMVARAAATSAVTRLANPEQVRVDSAARVLATWDACTLLRTVLGDKAGQYRLSRDDVDLAMDGCSASEKGKHILEFDFVLTLVYTTADWMNGPGSLSYGHPSTVEGKQVYIRDGVGAGTNCARAWTHEPLRPGAVPGLDGVDVDRVARVKIEGRTCELEPATAAIRAIPGGPPKAEPLPQVLYRADQPDLNYPGACVDYGGSWNGPPCQPAREVDIPDDTQQRWQAAANDPNVTCTIATPIVRSHLGAKLQPVTSGDHCAWVEPTHQVSLTIAVITGPRPNDYRGIGPTRDITIAGHLALRADDGEPDHPRWTIYASTGTDASQPGVIVAELTTFPPRGSVRDTPADAKPASVLEPLLAALFTRP